MCSQTSSLVYYQLPNSNWILPCQQIQEIRSHGTNNFHNVKLELIFKDTSQSFRKWRRTLEFEYNNVQKIIAPAAIVLKPLHLTEYALNLNLQTYSHPPLPVFHWKTKTFLIIPSPLNEEICSGAKKGEHVLWIHPEEKLCEQKIILGQIYFLGVDSENPTELFAFISTSLPIYCCGGHDIDESSYGNLCCCPIQELVSLSDYMLMIEKRNHLSYVGLIPKGVDCIELVHDGENNSDDNGPIPNVPASTPSATVMRRDLAIENDTKLVGKLSTTSVGSIPIPTPEIVVEDCSLNMEIPSSPTPTSTVGIPAPAILASVNDEIEIDYQVESKRSDYFHVFPINYVKGNFHVQGLEGSANSCYLDSVIFSMFAFTTLFDYCLDFPRNGEMALVNKTICNILKYDIITPLRTKGKVVLKSVLRLRTALAQYNKNFKNDMMDAEEFVLTLMEKVLEVPYFYSLDNNAEDYIYQLMVTLPDKPKVNTTLTTLLNSSFIEADVKLNGLPNPAFIIKLPVSNGQRLFNVLLPEPELSLDNLILPPTKNANRMTLRAVICLKSHHYTCFVRADDKKHWIFFDSMQGQSSPMVQELLFLNNALENSAQARKNVNDETFKSFQYLLQHAYMCFYEPVKQHTETFV